MTNIAITNTFSSGNTISSSQVNQNFTDVATYLNTTGVAKYQAATVTGAALADELNNEWRTHMFAQGTVGGAGAGTTTWIITGGQVVADGSSIFGTQFSPVNLSPAMFAVVSGKTVQLRVFGTIWTNASAPASQTYSVGLMSISSQADLAVNMTGTFVAGGAMTKAVTGSDGSGSFELTPSTPATCPASGGHAFVFKAPSGLASGKNVHVQCGVQWRLA